MDITVSVQALEFVPHFETALGELYRVLTDVSLDVGEGEVIGLAISAAGSSRCSPSPGASWPIRGC